LPATPFTSGNLPTPNSLDKLFIFSKMQFTQSQIQTFQNLGIYDQVSDILAEYSPQFVKSKILVLLSKIRLESQQKIYKIVHTREFLNPYKLTTIDPIELQKSLSTMVKNGCQVAIIEISSQGLEQNRHWGLGKFDAVGFLNLYPEHIDSHGSFENYKNCKLKLFQSVKNSGIAVVNGDDQYSEEFLNILPSSVSKVVVHANKDFVIGKYSSTIYKNFEVKNMSDFSTLANINSHLMADFEIYNVMIGARLIDKFLKTNFDSSFDFNILNGNYFSIPGRLEWVVQDNKIIFESYSLTRPNY
jgi:UDP-N-acetylmuramyl tripeptide synthase